MDNNRVYNMSVGDLEQLATMINGDLRVLADKRLSLLGRIYEHYKKHPHLMSLEMLEELKEELDDG